MKSDIITIILGFIEGFSLITSPCILPILPIILAGSLTGSKTRPLGIITGFTLSFAFFAFFSRQLVQYSGIDLNLIRYIAYGILLLIGLLMLSTYLTEKFSLLAQRLANLASIFSSKSNVEGGFLSGLFLGGLVALIWTPCAGPILAAVIVQIAIQKTTITGFFTLLAFALGAAVPMIIIALYGMKIVDTFSFFKTHSVLFRRILGVIIIASVGYMIHLERGFAISSVDKQTGIRTSYALEKGLWQPYPAPAIGGIRAWINSPPLQLTELKGKVILIDFWAYSCINCIRTLPYLKDWYNKYHDKGLVIIGVHTPEFDFEKNIANVQRAVKHDGILYPVALDNQFVTWRNFNNLYWPALYLINRQGDVVYRHFGEGDDEVTENNIRFLLGINGLTTPTPLPREPYSFTQTPETYLGYARADSSFSPSLIHDQVAHYNFPLELPVNSWGLQGAWQVRPDKIIAAEANAALKIHFNARKVFIVMGNSNAKHPISVKLLLNGEQLITGKGKDVRDSQILVDKYSIYEVVQLKQFASGILQLTTREPGVEIYTITFGS
jgi:cytochrome c biogenesis protein CcdA/thiol-disulfide isomerase/thioredoxin